MFTYESDRIVCYVFSQEDMNNIWERILKIFGFEDILIIYIYVMNPIYNFQIFDINSKVGRKAYHEFYEVTKIVTEKDKEYIDTFEKALQRIEDKQ